MLQGKFPCKLSIEKVTRISKRGNAQDREIFRPISVLPSFGKILEKTVEIQFAAYLEGNELFIPAQLILGTVKIQSTLCIYLFEIFMSVADIFIDVNKRFRFIRKKHIVRIA